MRILSAWSAAEPWKPAKQGSKQGSTRNRGQVGLSEDGSDFLGLPILAGAGTAGQLGFDRSAKALGSVRMLALKKTETGVRLDFLRMARIFWVCRFWRGRHGGTIGLRSQRESARFRTHAGVEDAAAGCPVHRSGWPARQGRDRPHNDQTHWCQGSDSKDADELRDSPSPAHCSHSLTRDSRWPH